jgi:hypothetical protein
MYRRTVVLCTWSVALLTCAFSAVLINRNLSARAEQTVTQSRPAGKARNLSLQPEAFKMSRRLGSRFMPSRQSTLTMLGTLTPGSVQQNLSITRRQTATGEEVGIAGEAGTLAWSDLEGARASGANLSEAPRLPPVWRRPLCTRRRPDYCDGLRERRRRPAAVHPQGTGH